ncbi:MAG: DUF1294 domain-containing protein [Clostridiales bacterium]|nr:DUF1294 domain-containing protein [Clostridiales bacterium]
MKAYFYIASGYILIINLLALTFFYSDKKRAMAGRRRIPEAHLFLLAFIGGSLGSIMGMHIFRHKTRHLSFRLGMPLILIIQLVAVVFMAYTQ